MCTRHCDHGIQYRIVARRIIGNIIGAIIAIIIIDSVQNIWLLSLLFFIFTSVYLSFVKITNYAFVVIFMTIMILLFIEISYPTTDTTTSSLERIQNIFIGCVLSLVASSIWIAFHRKKSNLPLEHIGIKEYETWFYFRRFRRKRWQ